MEFTEDYNMAQHLYGRKLLLQQLKAMMASEKPSVGQKIKIAALMIEVMRLNSSSKPNLKGLGIKK
jgi:hypothetical protein